MGWICLEDEILLCQDIWIRFILTWIKKKRFVSLLVQVKGGSYAELRKDIVLNYVLNTLRDNSELNTREKVKLN